MSALRDLARLMRLGRPPLAWCLISAAALVGSASVATLPPLVSGAIIDALVRENAGAVLSKLGLLCGVAVAGAALAGASGYATAAARENVLRNLRRTLLASAHDATLGALHERSFGQLTNRVCEDVDVLCAKVEYGLLPALQALLAAGSVIAAMVVLDSRLALVAVLAAAVGVLPPRFLAGVFQRLQRDLAANHDDRLQIASESLSYAGSMLFRHPRARVWLSRRYDGCIAQTMRLRMQSAAWEAVAGIASATMSLAGPIAILAAGAFAIVHHHATAGLLVTFLMYYARLGAPLGTLTNLPVALAGSAVVARRLLEIVELEREAVGTFDIGDARIAMHDVAIDRGERRILDNVVFQLPRGTHLALSGASGCGKSSLASAMLAYIPVKSGTIEVGGTPLEALDRGRLRERVVLVAQDPAIVEGTLEENLLLLADARAQYAIDAALRITCFDRVVAQSEEGLERRIGARGSVLSGGERQRLCLARALLAQPDVLILDEALSGVDIEMEAGILARLRSHMSGRTLVVISHRPESFAAFDLVATIGDGRLIVQQEPVHV